MSNDFPMKKLAVALKQRSEFIEIDDFVMYKRCRVQLHAQGIVERDTVPGAEIKTKRQQICHANEFLVAEIDAKVGGFGIVPDSLERAIVSSHYFLFIVNEALLDRRFLDYCTRTPSFMEQVRAQGTTNYAAIRSSHVLDYEIPLPPLEKQRRIVARIEALATKIEEARGLRREAIIANNALIHAAYNEITKEVPLTHWTPLKTYVKEIENGWSPLCENQPASNNEWGVLKLGAVSFGVFDERENKTLPSTLEPKVEYEVRPGDFLMSRANTTNLVGACAVVQQTRPQLMLCDKIFRLVFYETPIINRNYLEHILKSPYLRSQIERSASGTSPTMKNISKEKVLNLLIPDYDIKEQQRIVAYLDGLQAKVDTLKRIQAESSAELDALLPSILDKAFKGEL